MDIREVGLPSRKTFHSQRDIIKALTKTVEVGTEIEMDPLNFWKVNKERLDD